VGLSFGFDPLLSPFLRPSFLGTFGQRPTPTGAPTNLGAIASNSPATVPHLTLVKSTDVEDRMTDRDRDQSSR
jgi:hypothetical protein